MSTSSVQRSGARSGPNRDSTSGLERLSSGGTVWWRSIFPTLFSVGVGGFMVGIWMGWWAEPGSEGAKIAMSMAWAVASVFLALFGRSLNDVWLAEDRLIVSGKEGRREIPLEDIVGFSETRAQKVKSIKIQLRPGSPLGPSIRFLPPLRLQAPFSEHPVIGRIEEQKRKLAGNSGASPLPR